MIGRAVWTREGRYELGTIGFRGLGGGPTQACDVDQWYLNFRRGGCLNFRGGTSYLHQPIVHI